MDSYGLQEQFEQSVVHTLCSDKWFFHLFNKHIEPDLLSTDAARLAVETAKAIFADVNDAPGAISVVLNRANTYVNQGKIDIPSYADLAWYLSEPPDANDPKILAKEFAPILKERLRHQSVLKAIDARQKRDSLSSVAKAIEEIEQIGEYVEGRAPLSLDDDSLFAALEKMANLDRFPTGWDEVDLNLTGGLPRGNVGVLIGRSGGGKSVSLSQLCSFAYANGKTVAHICVSEIPGEIGGARVLAPIIGMRISDITRDINKAREAWAKYRSTHSVGGYQVFDFPSKVTLSHIRNTVTDFYAKYNTQPDFIVIDYVGLITSSRAPKNANTYAIGEYVMTEMLDWAKSSKAWIWTAAQSQRGKGKGGGKSVLTLDDIADSYNVVRVADVVLTLNVHETNLKEFENQIFVAKHRLGPSGQITSPQPVLWDHGLVASSSFFQERKETYLMLHQPDMMN